MAEDRMLSEVVRDIHEKKKSGALYVSVVTTSEDLIRVYFEKGDIYHLRYGSAMGKDVLDILEYYDLYSATFFEGIKAPDAVAKDIPPMSTIISQISANDKQVKVR